MDFINICGVIVTIIGFIITILTLLKTKKSIVLVNNAISDVKERVLTYRASSNLNEIIMLLKEFNKLLQERNNHKILIDRCDNVRVKLITLQKFKCEAVNSQDGVLLKAIRQLKSMRDSFSSMVLSENTDIAKMSKIISITTKTIDDLIGALAEIHDSEWR